MACTPTSTKILRGFFFIVALLIYLMCERWMMNIKVMGTPTYHPHVYNHVFLLWTVKMFLVALLYLLWKAIDLNWMGMRRFQHAETDETETQPYRRRFNNLTHSQESIPSGAVNAVDGDVIAIQPNSASPRQRRRKTYTKFLFLLPSMFNQAHILLIYFGAKLTYDSSIIMLTGTAAMFVTLLSLAFLAKPISSFMWVGVTVTTAGFAISGLSDYISTKPPGYEPYGIAAGALLFTMGQITMTTQMVYEEKFMSKLSIHPMKFLGSEGIYSTVFALIMLACFCLSDTQYSDLPNNRIEDIEDAALQFGNSWRVVLAVFGSLISYIVFTYLGMILIKDHGAMSRIMIEAVAWCIYWAILVGIGWENYYITQIPGLVLVPVGVLIFLHIVGFPCSNTFDAPDACAAHAFNEIQEQDQPDGHVNQARNNRGNRNMNGAGAEIGDDNLLQDGLMADEDEKLLQ